MDNVEVVERGNIVVNIYEGQKGTLENLVNHYDLKI